MESILNAVEQSTSAEPPNVSAPTDWLVVVSRSSGSSFQLHRAGLESSLELINDEALGTCVVQRFSSSPQSWSLLASCAGEALIGFVSRYPDDVDATGALCFVP